MSSSIKMEKISPDIAVLILNRPDKRNALNLELIEELSVQIETLAKDDSQRVIILQGAGKAFCAGLDLHATADKAIAHHTAKALAHLLQLIAESPLIFIAAVHGAAVGGGAGLMAACDLVIVAEGTHIGFPETRRGLVAALVMPFLCRRISHGHMSELVLLGELISAEKAVSIGLVNKITLTEQLHVEAMKWAELILEGGPQAVRLTKFLQVQQSRPLSEALKIAMQVHQRARDSDEAAAGYAAFHEQMKK